MQADAVLGEFSGEKSWITAVSAQLEEILIDKSESLSLPGSYLYTQGLLKLEYLPDGLCTSPKWAQQITMLLWVRRGWSRILVMLRVM